jgi:magnesium-protoporphyrin O-methyltransferase
MSMTCCRCTGVESVFTARVAAGDLRRYRKHGAKKTTRLLVDAIAAAGTADMTLLDIGGGVGVIAHELMRAGVGHVTGVEAARAYLDAAREEAERRGYAERATMLHGDFVALAPTIPAADIVTLDRVICCYPDMPALVAASTGRAKRLYGVIYPRDGWWTKAGFGFISLLWRLMRNCFRTHIHPVAAIDAAIRDAGLTRRYSHQTMIWRIVLYQRDGD